MIDRLDKERFDGARMLLVGDYPSGPVRVGLRRARDGDCPGALELLVGGPAHPGRPETYLVSSFLVAWPGLEWFEPVAYSLRAAVSAVRDGTPAKGLPPLKLLLGEVPNRSGATLGFGSSDAYSRTVMWSFRQSYGPQGSSMVVHALHVPPDAALSAADRLEAVQADFR